MKKTIIILLLVITTSSFAGMPEASPGSLAKSCTSVVVVQATNRAETVQYDVVNTIRGLTPTSPLPREVSSALARLKSGNRAVVFLELKPTPDRLRVRKIAEINGGKVHYLGPRPGELSTGKQVHDFDLVEFLEIIKREDSQH